MGVPRLPKFRLFVTGLWLVFLPWVAWTAPTSPPLECIGILDGLIHPDSDPFGTAIGAETHTHFGGVLPVKELAAVTAEHSPAFKPFARGAGARAEEKYLLLRLYQDALGGSSDVPSPQSALRTRPTLKGPVVRQLLDIFRDTVGHEATLAEINSDKFWSAMDAGTLDKLLDRTLTGKDPAKGLRFDRAYETRTFLMQDMRYRSPTGDKASDDYIARTFKYLEDQGIRHVEFSQGLGIYGAPWRNGGRNDGFLMDVKLPDGIDVYWLGGIINSHLRGGDGDPIPNLQSSLKIKNFVGVDIMGGEGHKMGPEAGPRLTTIYQTMAASKTRDRYVLRIHAGEGLRPEASDRRVLDPPAEVGRANVETVLKWAEEMAANGTDFKNGKVILRVAHLTHATPEQIARFIKLGVYLEMLPGSNQVTGVAPKTPIQAVIPGKMPHEMAGHPILGALAMRGKVMLGADGDGVMGTSVGGEYGLVRDMVESYREGNFKIQVVEDGKPVWKAYGELSDEMQKNMDKAMENIGVDMKDYIFGMTGRPAPADKLPFKPPPYVPKKVPSLK